MSATPSEQTHPHCARCARELSAEQPVRLPDAREYCAACCERMATEAFEMETGVPFVAWIEKHPELVLEHLPMEMYIRRAGFFIPLACALFGLLVFGYGLWAAFRAPAPGSVPAEELSANENPAKRPEAQAPRTTSAREPEVAWKTGAGFAAVGLGTLLLFGWLAWRQGKAYLRARSFRLTLKDGHFRLQHGAHEESFSAVEVTQACVVRPGTVGATEGALGLADGRMLTLDSCLTGLHALGVVMDLRFRENFPPSTEDLARERRDKLRKIRGLS